MWSSEDEGQVDEDMASNSNAEDDGEETDDNSKDSVGSFHPEVNVKIKPEKELDDNSKAGEKPFSNEKCDRKNKLHKSNKCGVKSEDIGMECGTEVSARGRVRKRRKFQNDGDEEDLANTSSKKSKRNPDVDYSPELEHKGFDDDQLTYVKRSTCKDLQHNPAKGGSHVSNPDVTSTYASATDRKKIFVQGANIAGTVPLSSLRNVDRSWNSVRIVGSMPLSTYRNIKSQDLINVLLEKSIKSSKQPKQEAVCTSAPSIKTCVQLNIGGKVVFAELPSQSAQMPQDVIVSKVPATLGHPVCTASGFIPGHLTTSAASMPSMRTGVSSSKQETSKEVLANTTVSNSDVRTGNTMPALTLTKAVPGEHLVVEKRLRVPDFLKGKTITDAVNSSTVFSPSSQTDVVFSRPGLATDTYIKPSPVIGVSQTVNKKDVTVTEMRTIDTVTTCGSIQDPVQQTFITVSKAGATTPTPKNPLVAVLDRSLLPAGLLIKKDGNTGEMLNLRTVPSSVVRPSSQPAVLFNKAGLLTTAPGNPSLVLTGAGLPVGSFIKQHGMSNEVMLGTVTSSGVQPSSQASVMLRNPVVQHGKPGADSGTKLCGTALPAGLLIGKMQTSSGSVASSIVHTFTQPSVVLSKAGISSGTLGIPLVAARVENLPAGVYIQKQGSAVTSLAPSHSSPVIGVGQPAVSLHPSNQTAICTTSTSITKASGQILPPPLLLMPPSVTKSTTNSAASSDRLVNAAKAAALPDNLNKVKLLPSSHTQGVNELNLPPFVFIKQQGTTGGMLTLKTGKNVLPNSRTAAGTSATPGQKLVLQSPRTTVGDISSTVMSAANSWDIKNKVHTSAEMSVNPVASIFKKATNADGEQLEILGLESGNTVPIKMGTTVKKQASIVTSYEATAASTNQGQVGASKMSVSSSLTSSVAQQKSKTASSASGCASSSSLSAALQDVTKATESMNNLTVFEAAGSVIDACDTVTNAGMSCGSTVSDTYQHSKLEQNTRTSLRGPSEFAEVATVCTSDDEFCAKSDKMSCTDTKQEAAPVASKMVVPSETQSTCSSLLSSADLGKIKVEDCNTLEQISSVPVLSSSTESISFSLYSQPQNSLLQQTVPNLPGGNTYTAACEPDVTEKIHLSDIPSAVSCLQKTVALSKHQNPAKIPYFPLSTGAKQNKINEKGGSSGLRQIQPKPIVTTFGKPETAAARGTEACDINSETESFKDDSPQSNEKLVTVILPSPDGKTYALRVVPLSALKKPKYVMRNESSPSTAILTQSQGYSLSLPGTQYNQTQSSPLKNEMTMKPIVQTAQKNVAVQCLFECNTGRDPSTPICNKEESIRKTENCERLKEQPVSSLQENLAESKNIKFLQKKTYQKPATPNTAVQQECKFMFDETFANKFAVKQEICGTGTSDTESKDSDEVDLQIELPSDAHKKLGKIHSGAQTISTASASGNNATTFLVKKCDDDEDKNKADQHEKTADEGQRLGEDIQCNKVKQKEFKIESSQVPLTSKPAVVNMPQMSSVSSGQGVGTSAGHLVSLKGRCSLLPNKHTEKAMSTSSGKVVSAPCGQIVGISSDPVFSMSRAKIVNASSSKVDTISSGRFSNQVIAVPKSQVLAVPSDQTLSLSGGQLIRIVGSHVVNTPNNQLLNLGSGTTIESSTAHSPAVKSHSTAVVISVPSVVSGSQTEARLPVPCRAIGSQDLTTTNSTTEKIALRPRIIGTSMAGSGGSQMVTFPSPTIVSRHPARILLTPGSVLSNLGSLSGPTNQPVLISATSVRPSKQDQSVVRFAVPGQIDTSAISMAGATSQAVVSTVPAVATKPLLLNVGEKLPSTDGIPAIAEQQKFAKLPRVEHSGWTAPQTDISLQVCDLMQINGNIKKVSKSKEVSATNSMNVSGDCTIKLQTVTPFHTKDVNNT